MILLARRARRRGGMDSSRGGRGERGRMDGSRGGRGDAENDFARAENAEDAENDFARAEDAENAEGWMARAETRGCIHHRSNAISGSAASGRRKTLVGMLCFL
jgi:hypothetical protein